MTSATTAHRAQSAHWAQSLADVTWHVVAATRHALPAGTGVAGARGAAALVYVLQGSASVAPARGDASPTRIPCGGLMLSLEGRAVRADDGDAVVVLAALEPQGSPAAVAALPEQLAIPDFAAAEPTIALLAAGLGCPTDREARPLDGVVCRHIATTVLTAALRVWAESDGHAATRVADPHLSRALAAIHAEPAHPWSLAELAALSAMSRSAFAARFREAVGMPPLRYLARVRIAAAKQHLLRGTATVAATASMLGYASEDGFSRAFQRHEGLSPSAWRRSRRSGDGARAAAG